MPEPKIGLVNDAPNPHTRIGDADRNQAFDQLGRFFAEGYLDLSEYDERSAQLVRARTRGELDAVFHDLPTVTPAAPSRELALADELSEKLALKRRRDAVTSGIGAVGCITFFALMFTGVPYAWVVFPVLGALIAVTYIAFGIGDEEDDILEEIEEKENQARAERLRVAYERRKELG